MLTPAEEARYSRHLLLPEVGVEGQLALKGGSVLVVGLGGLGCPAALYLAAAGVGRIGLADDDTVELSNLQRQVLFDTAAVGEPKALVAARRLSALNPEIEALPHPVRVTEKNAAALAESYDVILDGTDNFPARFALNDAALRHGKPLVHGAIHGFEGQLSVFAPHLGAALPCLRCLIPELPPEGAVPT